MEFVLPTGSNVGGFSPGRVFGPEVGTSVEGAADVELLDDVTGVLLGAVVEDGVVDVDAVEGEVAGRPPVELLVHAARTVAAAAITTAPPRRTGRIFPCPRRICPSCPQATEPQ